MLASENFVHSKQIFRLSYFVSALVLVMGISNTSEPMRFVSIAAKIPEGGGGAIYPLHSLLPAALHSISLHSALLPRGSNDCEG